MTTASWAEHRDSIAAQLAAQPRWLVASDFDGTLAPIAPHPQDAVLPPDTRAALQQLAALPGVSVAILTGRTLADIRARAALDGVFYGGCHGLEIGGPGLADFSPPDLEPACAELRAVIATLAPRVRGIPGVFVEDKTLCGAVHYRQADPATHGAIALAVREAVAGCAHLDLRVGKMVLEIYPRLMWHKGIALCWLLDHLALPEEACVFLGDDLTDEDAFAVAPSAITVHIGENPATQARYHLASAEEVPGVLRWLDQLRVKPPA